MHTNRTRAFNEKSSYLQDLHSEIAEHGRQYVSPEPSRLKSLLLNVLYCIHVYYIDRLFSFCVAVRPGGDRQHHL